MQPQSNASSAGVGSSPLQDVTCENITSDDNLSPSPSKNAMPLSKKKAEDYIFGKIIGEGSFSTVFLAKDIQTQKEYAIKVCEKQHIIREKKTAYIKREKEVLMRLGAGPSPFFVKLFCTFQDRDRLYFVLSYAKNGELLSYIHRVGSFDEDVSKFYAAEIVLALEYMHSRGIIHRDLKPENILLSEGMHVMITDFGSAKILDAEQDESNSPTGTSPPAGSTVPAKPRRNSFVGTAQYVSPELLNNKPISKSLDLWALGAIIYQFLSGLPPFRAGNEYLIFQKVVKLEYDFPEGFNEVGKDLVQSLLVLDAKKRLGSDECGGYKALKAHAFFNGIPWGKLDIVTPPPIVPFLPAVRDNPNFKSEIDLTDLPGLRDEHFANLMLEDKTKVAKKQKQKVEGEKVRVTRRPGMLNIPCSEEERESRKQNQACNNPWHKFVEGNLILKMGYIDKRKGLFARRRMFLLTEGPHLYYVDPVNQVLKGEIPLSKDIRPEPKNFKIFFVHTPNRTYYLEDPEGYSLKWCEAIEEMYQLYFATDS
ncbi:PREDICTED: 3-phosphoinositide-dependent protein kinase 1-like isoform X3 [Priapulus caudatus]|nr:PREDICTED: 3-phosphoinositide-dependent protein kinase 1-like isoform X2 [Priapulus caudatus]XP_014663196.1 PREDICTED: 3-phosphoinositide-dependent protein kinase 1-like isoform X2 [Priapulus caudatus]XP_014663197.1 PREDICTED: 3-phosphoinositide-dependent protein kinase 1-like isoform X2 [Priapulus caudatus]XP_014663198.1 PREDICTED: 3-phosphoinositide-dependent protein kinase 1-like isoform X3 [Priapulus caudatus]XP_014663199.1 PREDICTED: 3-phosphoinositide-dependent protein kinase 1-like is